MRNKSKGFTLIEILGTIVIITIVFGIAGTVVFNIINSSKEKSKELAKSNIEKISKVYISEYSEEIAWALIDPSDENNKNKHTCISVNSLLSKGYLKEEEVIEQKGKFVEIIKDENSNIISNKVVDNPEDCGYKVVKVPTSRELCKDITYDGSSQSLVNIINSTLYDNSNNKLNGINVTSNINEKNAGDYNVNLKLSAGYVWNDDSSDEKSVTCTIKKGFPALSVTPASLKKPSVGEETITLTSNVYGKVYVKSSDLKYITIGDIGDGNIVAGGTTNIKLNILSTRNTDTYITITVVPSGDDANNYYTKSIVLPVINIKKPVVNVDYREVDGTIISSCEPETIEYRSNYGELCKPTKPGYKFVDWYFNDGLTGEQVTSDTVVSNYKDHSLYAKWIPNIITVKYNANGGAMASTHGAGYAIDSNGFVTKNGEIFTDSFKYSDDNINLSNYNYASKINIVKVGYKAVDNAQWKNVSGVTFNQNEGMADVTKLCDATNGDCEAILYVNWTPQVYTITYKANGGSGNDVTQNVTYGTSYALKSNSSDTKFTKTNYDFFGWATGVNNNITSAPTLYSATSNWNRTSDLTLYAQWKKTITLTVVHYNGTTKVTDYKISKEVWNNITSYDFEIPDEIINRKYTGDCSQWRFMGFTGSQEASSKSVCQETCENSHADWKNNRWDSSVNSSGQTKEQCVKACEKNKTYKKSESTPIYARYDEEIKFIYDYNGGVPVSSVYHTKHLNASGKSSNLYNSDGSEFKWSEKIGYSSVNASSPFSITRSGCTFVGWYDQEAEKYNGGATVSYSCDYMVSAQWNVGCD